MLLPKRTKFRKVHRGRLKGTSKANTIVFGDYGIQAQEPVWLTSRQIEATRRSITRYVRKTGKIWIRVFRIGCWIWIHQTQYYHYAINRQLEFTSNGVLIRKIKVQV